MIDLNVYYDGKNTLINMDIMRGDRQVGVLTFIKVDFFSERFSDKDFRIKVIKYERSLIWYKNLKDS